ncbi:uncharacterized protein LOC143200990 isoform X1 [Rhynchophorus ferrugineus]|uniref:uncharacterized protein LOC143200990 isoform X1 n=1 Tax=Rhynchophorus ferrugineus TaxID=354439 RepID=UPI003FCE2023
MRQGLALEISCDPKNQPVTKRYNRILRDDRQQAKVQDNGAENKDFCASTFVDNIMTKGDGRACDETSEGFNSYELPPYYDPKMFKRGQEFFHRHYFGMFLGSFLGLLCGLSMKFSLEILKLTGMSSSEYTSYKRYIATILHMLIWYDGDFQPGSKLWKSIEDVKFKHNSASKKSKCVLKYGIDQKSMALTQFGFIGFAITRRSYLGVHNASEYDLKCLIHVWRVLGYVLGIEDEFNICRDSVKETEAICEEILQKVVKPQFERESSDYNEMVTYMIDGLWSLNPFLDTESFQFYLKMVLNSCPLAKIPETEEYKSLSRLAKIKVKIVIQHVIFMRFSLIRNLLNYVQRAGIWIIQRYPFLAFYRYGKANSYIRVMGPN